MDEEKELRAELERLEAENASLRDRQELADRIARLRAENERIEARVARSAATKKRAGRAAAAKKEAAEESRGSRRRRWLVGLIVVLACLGVVVSGLTAWAHYTVLNTDGYMKIVGPIGKDPEAIRALSDYIAGQIVTATDLESRTAEALPPKAEFLAGPVTGAVEDFIANGTNKLLSTDKAYELWLKTNEVAHSKIVALLRGESTYAYIEGSDVKLDTLPLISQALVWLDDKLPGALGERFDPPVIEPGADPAQAIDELSTWTGKPLPDDFGQVTLLTSDALGPAQTAVELFDKIVWLLPIITAALVAAAIWLSRRRRRTVIQLGVGVAVALIMTRVIVVRASSALVDSIEQGNGLHVVRDVVNASLGPLSTITIWVVVISAVAAVAAWFSGRHDLQAAVVETGRRVASRSQFDAAKAQPVTAWVWRHVTALRWAVLIVALILLAVITWSWVAIILTIAVAAVLELVLSLIAGEWPFGEG